MKKKRYNVNHFAWQLFILSFATSVDPSHGQYQRYNGLTVREQVVLPDRESHPSLYFSSSDLDKLRARKDKIEYKRIWAEIKKDAQYYLEQNAQEQNYADRPRMAKTLAFWWLIEDDNQALNKSIEALMLAYDGVLKSGEPPFDEIRRATWLQNYCLAYDWVHSELSAAQDSVIRAKVIDEVQWLRDNLTDGLKIATGYHNHRLKPSYAIATAALTFSSHPNAYDWLEYALKQQNEVTRYIISADGIYREGGHYWMFVSVNLIPFLWSYYNVSGVDLFTFYQPFFEWPVKVRMGRGWIPNHEDGFLQPAPTYLVAERYLNRQTDLHTTASLGNILQWHFLNTKIHFGNYTGATKDVIWEIDAFILYDSSIEQIAPDSSPTVKIEGGQVILRNSWQPDAEHRYLLFHGVAEADYHNHPDQLSFLIEANDANLIADAGYGKTGWPDEKRYSWYTLPKAHNIVTVDSLPPVDRERDKTPPTPFFFDSNFCDFTEKQAVFKTEDSTFQKRAIMFVGEDYWVVSDIVQGNKSHQFRSYLHGRGDFKNNGHYVSWETQDDRFGKSAKIHAFLFPQAAELYKADGYISLFKDETQDKYVYLEQYGKEALFMQILIPCLTASSAPAVVDNSKKNIISATVSRGETYDSFFLQANPTLTSTDEISTDATFVWTRLEGNELVNLTCRSMTTFGYVDKIKIISQNPATIAFDLGETDKLTIHLDEKHVDSLGLQIQWQESNSVSAVFINNNEVEFHRVSSNLLEIGTVISSFNNNPPLLPEKVLLTNYPNPFNSNTKILYKILLAGQYSISVYNILGRKLKTIKREFHTAGEYEISWNATDNFGKVVAVGIYIIKMRNETNKQVELHKVLFIK